VNSVVLDHGQDGLALELTASQTDSVGELWLTAARAEAHRRGGQLVVLRATHCGSGLALAFLWYGHFDFSLDPGRSVFGSVGLLFEILERRPSQIVGRPVATALPLIQIVSAFRTEAFAVFVTEWAWVYLQQKGFTDEWDEV